MILVDTSVWVDHLRRADATVVRHLRDGAVACHPLVVGELSCGTLRNRDEVLTLLEALPRAHVAEHQEALAFLAAHRLWGTGLGWIDVHLLASARLSQVRLWTLDARLRRAAERLDLAATAR